MTREQTWLGIAMLGALAGVITVAFPRSPSAVFDAHALPVAADAPDGMQDLKFAAASAARTANEPSAREPALESTTRRRASEATGPPPNERAGAHRRGADPIPHKDQAPCAPREHHDVIAHATVQSLGWRQDPEDATRLGRWLDRGSSERAAVLGSYGDPRQRADVYNQALTRQLAELRDTFGDLRAAQLVERLGLAAIDPDTGEALPVGIDGKPLGAGSR